MGADDDRATGIRRGTGGAEAHYRRDRGADGGDFPSDRAGEPGAERRLRSQDAWKIKAGLERGEYSVGSDGQNVRIDPSMVSFVESVPDYVVEEPFEGGVVYLDTRMSKELVAEGYAREIVELVREARQDMKIAQDRVVDIELVAGKDLRAKLQPWKDMILRDSNALDVQFVTEPAADAYVIEAGLGEETFLLGVRAAEM